MMILPIAELTKDENKALIDCLGRLGERRPRALIRDNFYNTKKILDKVGFSIPPSMVNLEAVVGWPQRAVDGLAGRLKLHGFALPNQKGMHPEVEMIFNRNRMAVEWPQTQISTLKHGCSFVAVTPGDQEAGEPKTMIQTMPATECSGVWDVRKRQLSSAVWLPDADQMLNKTCILFLPDHTVQMTRGASGPWVIKRIPNKLPRVPVTPVVYRQQLGRPFGMSRISRAVIYLCQMAARTLLRTEVGAEFYNAPQRYAMGASAEDFQDEQGNPVSTWETVLGRVWLIPRDEEGEIPTVGQFPQQTMQPNVDMMRMITTLFAGETSLPVSSLGIIHDNPASAAAIDAAWADMTELAEQVQDEFGVAATEIAQNALMVETEKDDISDDLAKLKPKWRNASTPTLGAMTDAVTKQIQAGMLQPDSEVALEQAGYDEVDIRRIKAEHEAAKADDPLRGVNSLLNPGVSGASRDLATQAAEPPANELAGAAVGGSVPPAGRGRPGQNSQ